MLYINEVVNMFNNAVDSKLYADDLNLHSKIVTEAHTLILQHDLDDMDS